MSVLFGLFAAMVPAGTGKTHEAGSHRTEVAMRYSKALAVIVGLLAVFCVPGIAQAAELTGGPVVNVGHRGTAGLAPEHTIVSYDLALEDGADYIEQDRSCSI